MLRLFASLLLLLTIACRVNAEPAVSLAEDNAGFTLSNSFVTARIEKKSGSITSLKYKDHDVVQRAY